MERYHTVSGFASRKIGGEQVLVPTGKMTQKFNGMITQNESAAFLWSVLKTPKTMDEVVEEVMNEFEVDLMTARRDVFGFIKGGIEVGTIAVEKDE